MNFAFTRKNLSPHEARLERILEILPGFTSWSLLIGMVVVSFWNPIVGAVIIIAFDFYWLLRLLFMVLFLILSSLRLSIEKEPDWMDRVRGFDCPGSDIQNEEKDSKLFKKIG